MEYTVNQQNIQKYAERLSNDLCRQFFINKAFISGPEILAFNNENQVNLLIIKNIFLNWQKEALKLKSPFFDYEDEDVKLGLKTFMNKLSNHIKVYRYDFEPVLQRSICDFILLSAAPQDFFTKEIEALASPKISVGLLKDFAKYIKVNKFVLDHVISDIEAGGYTEIFGGETIRFVLKALGDNPEKVSPADEALSGLFEQLPASVNEFVALPKPLVTRPAFLDLPKTEFVSEPVPVIQMVKPIPEPIPEEVVEEIEPSLQIPEQEEENKTEPEVLAEEIQSEIVEAPILVKLEEEIIEEIKTVEEPVFQKVEPVPSPMKQKLNKSEVLEMAKDPINLNDTLRLSEERSNLAQTLQTKTLSAPFKTLVPMHYRFTFINSLFGGNQQAWADAVEKIDKSENYEEAVAMLRSEFAEKFNWANEEDNAAILFNYVERKF
jgi:hypothetical protein